MRTFAILTSLLVLATTAFTAPTTEPAAAIEKRGCGGLYATRDECSADCAGGLCEANSVSQTSFTCTCVSSAVPNQEHLLIRCSKQ